MAFVVEFENGELREIKPDLRNPFRTIEQVISLSKKLEEEEDSTVKLHRVVIETPQLSEDAVKFMSKRLGVKIRRKKDDTHVIEFESDPVNFYAHYLAVLSSIDVGEKIARFREVQHYKQQDKEYLKVQARERIKHGAIRQGCPLVQQIAKLNGTDVNQVVNILVRYRRDKVREMLKATYEIVFDEPYTETETRKGKSMWTKANAEKDIQRATKYFTQNYTNVSISNNTDTGWDLE